MKRRDFIKTTSAFALPIAISGIPISVLSSARFSPGANWNDKVLVLIQLQGGNDGLNTLLPLDQYDNLASVREDIIIPRNSILDISEYNGFHPSLGGFRDIWDMGKMAIVQSAGYPNQNRSHFRSTDIWNSASAADEFVSSGWLGRYFDTFHPGFPSGYPNQEYPHPIAITVGSGVNETCQGKGANYSMALVDPYNPGTVEPGFEGELPENCYGKELTFLREIAHQTNAYSEQIISAANLGNNLSPKYNEIGNNRLAEKMAIIARLISGGLQTKVFVVQIGGFDTHGNQVNESDSRLGTHADLLRELSDAVNAFIDDLGLLNIDERVITMTFSEFGRRIRSNASLGTDHGTAGPMFLFGSCLENGILGENPEIGPYVDQNEGVPMQYDFRDVYGSLLVDWFESELEEVRSLLHQGFNPLPLINSCSTSSNYALRENKLLDFEVFPNPFSNEFKIKFTGSGEKSRISLFDIIGNEIRVLDQGYFSQNRHTLVFSAEGLSPGPYFIRISSDKGQRAKRIIKK